MTPRSTRMSLLAATWLAGCQCADADIVEIDSDASSSSSGETSTGSSTGGDGTTGEPFDASRWIGRYHFEHTFTTLGEPMDSSYAGSLTNFEILSDGRAMMFYDHCSYEEPLTVAYEWFPSEDGWLSLRPGPGETSLRFMANPGVETIRLRLIEPCRELEFEVDGRPPGFYIVRPGASCWVNRCTTPGIAQLDYCEGEEPPPCP
jgi:hypothetical protein